MPRKRTPWWGKGLDPRERWPGCVREIPCEWNSRRKRWEATDGPFYFDKDAADHVCDFFPACLQHHIGKWDGHPFDLLDYQRYLVRAMFGWKRTGSDLRRFRKVFLAVPKGNGKSPFGAGLAIYGAFFDDEPGAEAYAVAADRAQARIVFDGAKIMVERCDAWEGQFDLFRDSIKRIGSTEALHVLSSEASTKHGFRPHIIVFDEFHAQPNRDLYDTLYRGMGKRDQPLLVMITTAGDDDESICFEEWDYARKVISGTITNPEYLPMVFEASPDEDWTIEPTWERVNPGFGVTMRADYFETECQDAQDEPRKRNSFLQLHCNRWVNQATAWLPVEWWDRCQQDNLGDLSRLPVCAGLDLAQKWDLAALVLVFRRLLETGKQAEVLTVDEATGDTTAVHIDLNYELIIRPYFWIPEDTMKQHERDDGIPYRVWREQGLLTATEGATIDYSRIFRDIKYSILTEYPMLRQGLLGYDPAFATDLATQLKKHAGLRTHEVLQNYKHMSESCQILEALIRAGLVRHDGHRVLRNHVENVEVKRDDAGRIRPVRPRKQSKHIDGVVGSVMGVVGLQGTPIKRGGAGVFVV